MLIIHRSPPDLTCASPPEPMRLNIWSITGVKGGRRMRVRDCGPVSPSVITAGAAGAPRANESHSNMIKGKKNWATDESAWICKEFVRARKAERAHIGGDGHVTHSNTRPSHTHIPVRGGGHLSFSLAGLWATGAKANGDEGTQEGTHSSSFA